MDIKLLKELLDDTSKLIIDLKLHEEESDKLKKLSNVQSNLNIIIDNFSSLDADRQSLSKWYKENNKYCEE